MTRKKATLPWITAAMFAVLAIVNVVGMIVEGPWFGFTRRTFFIDGLLVALWSACAVGAALRKGWGYVACVIGALASIAHGAVLRFARESLGHVFLAAGFALLGLVIYEHRRFGLRATETRHSHA